MVTMMAYDIVSTVLDAFYVVPLFVIWISFLRTVRKKKDPARAGIVWLKAAFPVFIL